MAGKPYEQVVREQILVPCGMTHSGFDFASLKDKNKATGYFGIEDGEFQEAPIWDSTQSAAAGALYSTIGDMNKWHRALQSYQLLPKEWQEKAYQPYKAKYAYGWFVDSLNGRRTIKHSGGIPGFISYELRIEEDDVDIVMMQNQMTTGPDQKQMSRDIVECIYNKDFKMPQPPKIVAVDAAVLKKYEGDYALAPNFILNVSMKGDVLYAQATGQPAIKIVPETETMFYSKEANARIEFVNENGAVSKLILHQHGQNVPAVRK
jgi:CubicO group peptidase (beta-lactamase class C family)